MLWAVFLGVRTTRLVLGFRVRGSGMRIFELQEPSPQLVEEARAPVLGYCECQCLLSKVFKSVNPIVRV